MPRCSRRGRPPLRLFCSPLWKGANLCYVRARLTERAEDWRGSSTAAHIVGKDDHVVTVAPAIERVGDFAAFLGEPFDEALTYAALRKAESVGRPAGRARGWRIWRPGQASPSRPPGAG